MKCPHCLHEMHPTTAHSELQTYNSPVMAHGENAGKAVSLVCKVETCPKCHGTIIDLTFFQAGTNAVLDTLRLYPKVGPFPPAPPEVPQIIASDYSEANEVLPISAKASAALSRRCLQSVLSAHGYTGRDLVRQIEAALSETDATKSLPTAVRENIDAVRNFGNFSAHPITDQTTLQIVDVEAGEAEWCLQILLDIFDHYYVSPAKAAIKRAALGAKLANAGKPPIKQ